MKKLVVLLFALCFIFNSSYSQTSPSSAVTKDYQTYAIQLGSISSYDGSLDVDKLYERFRGVADLGLLYHIVPATPDPQVPLRVYLGSYLGRHTAERVIEEVRKRGYTDSFIFPEPPQRTTPPTTTVFQLASFIRPDMKIFKQLSQEMGQRSMYLLLANDGHFKLLTGLYESDLQHLTLKQSLEAKNVDYYKRDLSSIY